MRLESCSRRLAVLISLTSALGCGYSAAVPTAAFPPLNSPATNEQRPGKFVWADFFTTDPVAATAFYCGLFGWTATGTALNGRNYTVFSNGEKPVAGLVTRPAAKSPRPSRWIGYLAVKDLAVTLKAVAATSGQVRAGARDFPNRGIQAIIADNEGATVGVLQSTSGDAPDVEPQPGDWNWFELYVRSPRVTAVFYNNIFGHEVAADLRTERREDLILSSGGLARAGITSLPIRDDAQSGWLGVVRVADLDGALARAIRLGGEVLLAPRAVAYESRFAIVGDPTGGSIGMVEYAGHANPANRP